MDHKIIKWLFFVGLMVLLGILSLFAKNKRRYLVFLLALFAPFRTGIIFYRYNGIMLMDFVLIILLMFDFVSGRKTKLYYRKLSFPIIGLLVWSLLASLFAVEKMWAFSEWTRYFRAFLIFSYIISFVRTKKDLQVVLYGILAGFSIQSLIGFLQWRYGALGLWLLDENLIERWRSSGTFSYPVVFSTYLSFIFPLVFRMFIFSRGEKRKKIFLYGFIVVLGAIALYTTRGRGAWFSCFLALVTMFLFSIPKRKLRPKYVWPFAIVLFFFGIFAFRYGGSIMDRVSEAYAEDDRSATIRMPLNRVALRVIEAYPVFGTGLMNYQILNRPYVRPEGIYSYKDLQQEVHNVYLMLAAQNGIPSLLFFLWGVFYFFRIGKKVSKSKDPFIANLGIGITCSFIAILIAFMSTPDYRNHEILVNFWLMAGFLFAAYKLDINMNSPKRKYVKNQKQPQQPRLQTNISPPYKRI